MSYNITGTTITLTRGDTFEALVSATKRDGTQYIPVEGDVSMAAGVEREMLLSGSESSANSAEDSVKTADCWSVHMWMPFFLRGSSSRASFRILESQ